MGPGGTAGASGGGTAGTGGAAGSSAGGGGASGSASAGHDGGMDAAGAAGTVGGGEDAGQDVGDPLMPTLLSQTGLYSDFKAKTLAPGVYPYAPKYALWSDGAKKKRWVYLPPGAKIDTDSNPDSMEFWAYPKGMKLWKEFTVTDKTGHDVVVETRLLQKTDVGLNSWYMVAFKPNADGSDAVAVPSGELNTMNTTHDIPTKDNCVTCHKAMWDNVLGFSALQLSKDIGADEPSNSLNLAKVMQMGLLTTNPPGNFTLPGAATDQAALGYLHSNCGICHNIYGKAYMTDVDLDLWTHFDQIGTVQTTRAYLSMVCDVWPAGIGDGGAHDKTDPIKSCPTNHATGMPVQGNTSRLVKRIVPQMPAMSALHELMNERGDQFSMSQMPPLATKIVDPTGLGQLDAWINSLPTH